jgi:hypothetical protein
MKKQFDAASLKDLPKLAGLEQKAPEAIPEPIRHSPLQHNLASRIILEGRRERLGTVMEKKHTPMAK